MANIMRLGGGGGGKPKKLLSSLTEGSFVSVLEDGKLVPFYVAKHNYEADLNGEGRTLLVRRDTYQSMAWDVGGVNAYNGSDIDIWLNGEYFNMLSADVKAATGGTQFRYTAGNGTTSVTTLAKAVFTLSMTELGYASSYCNVEGSALPIASMLKISYKNGSTSNQWTRSPYTNGKNAAWFINMVASEGGAGVTTSNIDARPCFTLPDTMVLNEVPNADGTWTLADEVTIDVETASTTAKAGVNYANGIADLTPAQLHEIAAAISSNPNITKETSVVYYSKGDVHRKISVGDEVSINYTDASTIKKPSRIIGFNHDDLSWGGAYGVPTATGKAGMTFRLNDGLGGYAMNTNGGNNGGWATCTMRTNLAPIFLGRFDAALQSVIKSVNKMTNNGNKSSANTKTEDKFWLPSQVEIFNSISHTFAGEGYQYAYYKAGNSPVTPTNGVSSNYWMRSPYKDVTTSFCVFLANQNGMGALASTSSAGAPFAYCI